MLLFASCKQKEVLYTPEEAMRIADSAAQKEIEKISKEAAINLEFRKRVEGPYQFGQRTGSPVKNPYDTTGYLSGKHTLIVTPAADSASELPAVQKTVDPGLKKITDQESK